MANNFLRFDDSSKLTIDKDGLDGIKVSILLVKSRTNNAGKSVPMILDYTNGFDADLSLFEWLKDTGGIKGAGAYLYIDGHDDIKFALFGGEEEITDDMYDEVKNFAEYVKQKYKNKKEWINWQTCPIYML